MRRDNLRIRQRLTLRAAGGWFGRLNQRLLKPNVTASAPRTRYRLLARLYRAGFPRCGYGNFSSHLLIVYHNPALSASPVFSSPNYPSDPTSKIFDAPTWKAVCSRTRADASRACREKKDAAIVYTFGFFYGIIPSWKAGYPSRRTRGAAGGNRPGDVRHFSNRKFMLRKNL